MVFYDSQLVSLQGKLPQNKPVMCGLIITLYSYDNKNGTIKINIGRWAIENL